MSFFFKRRTARKKTYFKFITCGRAGLTKITRRTAINLAYQDSAATLKRTNLGQFARK